MIKKIRQFHLYAGLFFAPAIIFFAFSGVLQTFGFHEDQENGASAPYWIAAMAEVHKNQKLMDLPESPAPKASTPPTGSQNQTENANKDEVIPDPIKSPRHSKSLALQIFIAIMSVGLIASVVSGIFMAFTYQRKKSVIFGLLIAGTLIPVAALFL